MLRHPGLGAAAPPAAAAVSAAQYSPAHSTTASAGRLEIGGGRVEGPGQAVAVHVDHRVAVVVAQVPPCVPARAAAQVGAESGHVISVFAANVIEPASLAV